MGFIVDKVKICGSKGCKEINAVFDSGADVSVILPGLSKDIGAYESDVPTELKGFGEESEKIFPASIRNLEIKGCKLGMPRVYVKDIKVIKDRFDADMVIGNDIMQDIGLKLNMEKDRAELEKCEPKAKIMIGPIIVNQ